jgi:K(+)-stimulated pyrophosphate-energized sodium pump
MNLELFSAIAPYVGISGLLVALWIYVNILKQDTGTEKMRNIADLIHDGAMVFLKAD